MARGDDHGFELIVPSPKKVVSVKMEVDLIDEIDRLWPKLGYSSRSEFIKDAILYFMQVAPRIRMIASQGGGETVDEEHYNVEGEEDYEEDVDESRPVILMRAARERLG